MRLLFFKIIVFFSFVSCSNINFLLDSKEGSDFFKSKTLVYVEGWDVLRERRFQRAIEQGMVPADARMARMTSTLDWDLLKPERKRVEAKRMAVYAGMIEAMDFHIGRLVEYLKSQGVYENTVFIFTSDNGAEASGPDDLNSFLNQRIAASVGYHQDYDRLGLKGSYNSISPSFASAAASPLSFYKFYIVIMEHKVCNLLYLLPTITLSFHFTK